VGPIAALRDVFPDSDLASRLLDWACSTLVQQVLELQTKDGLRTQELNAFLAVACITIAVAGGSASLLFAAQGRRAVVRLEGQLQEVLAFDFEQLEQLMVNAGKGGHSMTGSAMRELLGKHANLGVWQHSLELPVLERDTSPARDWARKMDALGSTYVKIKCRPVVLVISALREDTQALIGAAIPRDVRAAPHPAEQQLHGSPGSQQPQPQDLVRSTIYNMLTLL
jgi:hypothetical protein